MASLGKERDEFKNCKQPMTLIFQDFSGSHHQYLFQICDNKVYRVETIPCDNPEDEILELSKHPFKLERFDTIEHDLEGEAYVYWYNKA